jgi:hypothetical protein
VLLLPVAVLLAAILLPLEPSKTFGLPAHPLLVHVPVVLVPLLAVAVVVLAVRPSWRLRYGLAAVVSAVVTMVGTILAAGAGEALRAQRSSRTGGPAGVPEQQGTGAAAARPGGNGGEGRQLAQHADLGAMLRLLVILFALALIVLVIVDRYGIHTGGRGGVLTSRPVGIALTVVVVVLAVLSLIWVIRTGHVGAQMTWGREGGGAPTGGRRPPG